MPNRARVVIVIVVAALVIGSVGLMAWPDGDTTGVEEGPWRQALVGVCAAGDLAQDGELDTAERAFQEVHQELHLLAGAADRSAAKSLLEDKAAVEAALASGDRAIAGRLEALASSVRRAAASTGGDPGACP